MFVYNFFILPIPCFFFWIRFSLHPIVKNWKILNSKSFPKHEIFTVYLASCIVTIME